MRPPDEAECTPPNLLHSRSERWQGLWAKSPCMQYMQIAPRPPRTHLTLSDGWQ